MLDLGKQIKVQWNKNKIERRTKYQKVKTDVPTKLQPHSHPSKTQNKITAYNSRISRDGILNPMLSPLGNSKGGEPYRHDSSAVFVCPWGSTKLVVHIHTRRALVIMLSKFLDSLARVTSGLPSVSTTEIWILGEVSYRAKRGHHSSIGNSGTSCQVDTLRVGLDVDACIDGNINTSLDSVRFRIARVVVTVRFSKGQR